jgi:hypothetical protein
MGVSSTSWRQGQSGNPSGRPKVIGYIRDLAREHTEEAVDTLLDVMRNQDAPSAARVAAAEAMLSRGWGKPTQPIAGDDAAPPITQIIRTIVDPKHTSGWCI